MFDFDQNNWCHTSPSRNEWKKKKHNYDLFTLDVLTVVISFWYADANGAIYATSVVRVVREKKIINSIALEIDFNYDSHTAFAYTRLRLNRIVVWFEYWKWNRKLIEIDSENVDDIFLFCAAMSQFRYICIGVPYHTG